MKINWTMIKNNNLIYGGKVHIHENSTRNCAFQFALKKHCPEGKKQVSDTQPPTPTGQGVAFGTRVLPFGPRKQTWIVNKPNRPDKTEPGFSTRTTPWAAEPQRGWPNPGNGRIVKVLCVFILFFNQVDSCVKIGNLFVQKKSSRI